MPDPLNVLFKRGPSSNLPTTGAVEGAFYLTTDTDRLYIGKNIAANGQTANVVPVELNKSITTVPTVDDLPQTGVDVGQFYYITGPAGDNKDPQADNTHGGNILAVVTSVTNGVPHWVQVNPDTDTNTNDNTKVLGAVTAQDMVDLSVSGATDSGTVTRFVFDGIDGGGNSGNPVTAHYRLIIEQDTTNIGGSTTHESDVIAKLDLNLDDLVTAGSVSVDVNSAAASNGSVNVHTTSMPSAGFSITGTGSVDVNSSTANSISIHGKEYDGTLSSTGTAASATISYVDAIDGVNQTPDTISVTGDGKVVVNGSTANQIGISHATSGVTVDTYGANNPTGDEFSPAGTIVIPQFTVDNTGHIIAASSESFTLPADTKVTGVSADNTGVITIANSDGVPVSSGQDLYYTIGQAAANGTVTSQTVYNKGDLGTYYTKTAIDSMLQGLDALTYKGTIGNAPATVQSLPAHPGNGDTYKVTTAGTYGDIACEVGDLLIATGEETDGVIASPTWTLVSTGSDTDTTYTFGVNGTTLTYTPSTASGVENTYATIAGGAELTASGSGTTITIDHDTQSGLAATQSVGLAADATPDPGDSFSVPYVTVNQYGHVTGLTSHTVTLPNQTVTALSSTGTVINLAQDGNAAGSVTLDAGSHISVAAGSSANHIEISHAGPGAYGAAITAGSNVGNGTPKPTANTTLSASDKFVVPVLSYDTLGHITGTSELTYQLPVDNNTTYTLSSAAATGLSTGTTGTTFTLDASTGGVDSTVTITSTSLAMTGNTIDIIWGSF